MWFCISFCVEFNWFCNYVWVMLMLCGLCTHSVWTLLIMYGLCMGSVLIHVRIRLILYCFCVNIDSVSILHGFCMESIDSEMILLIVYGTCNNMMLCVSVDSVWIGCGFYWLCMDSMDSKWIIYGFFIDSLRILYWFCKDSVGFCCLCMDLIDYVLFLPYTN